MAKRVAVMSPQTRLAHSRRRLRGRWRMPRLDPDDAERAQRNYRMQRRRGIASLVLIFAMLLGLPLLLRVAPWLTELRVWAIPVSWLVLAVLPYPLMSWLAAWQLRQAERIEDR
jgi:sterol desaturase/sphingolipid hydroxylase (fatty acid hydroxylase superfamily)